MFRRIDQALCIFTKHNGIIRNDIEGNVPCSKSYPSLAISANEENEPNLI